VRQIHTHTHTHGGRGWGGGLVIVEIGTNLHVPSSLRITQLVCVCVRVCVCACAQSCLFMCFWVSENGQARAFKAKYGHRIEYTTAPSSVSFSVSTNPVVVGHYNFHHESKGMVQYGRGVEGGGGGNEKEEVHGSRGVVLKIGMDSECFNLSGVGYFYCVCACQEEGGISTTDQADTHSFIITYERKGTHRARMRA